MKNLVLIPGLNNTAAVFDGVVSAMPSDVAAQAVTCDALPSVEALADALIDKLPERFWLAGFSFGGYVALAMLERYPERVEGIAMLCTAPFADTEAQKELRLKAMEKARSGGYKQMIAAQAANAFHPDSLKNAPLMAAREAMVDDYGVERFVAHIQAVMTRPDRQALLDGSIPTLILSASHDNVFTPQKVREYGERIPGARLVCIEDAGHLAPMERPEAVAQVLHEWVSA